MNKKRLSMSKFFNKYINDKIKLKQYQKIGVFCLIFVLAGIFGFVYEYIFYYFNYGMKEFYMQGGNFLPWINIYAFGAFIVIALSYKYKKNPLYVFLIAFFSTGIFEFLSGFILFKFFNIRFWDYNVEILNFGNIGGFVCLRSAAFFGVSSLILMYVILPFCIYLSQKMSKKAFLILSVSLFYIFLFDEIYNLIICRVLNTISAPDFYKSIGFKYM